MTGIKLFSGNGNSERISSLEIAQVTNKKHNHVMRDIREMEDAWEKITQSKFGRSEYVDPSGRHLPCYLLTLDQMLYVITKYNNEARAKLVLRWKELEQRERSRMQEELVYMNNVLKSEDTLTTTMIAKEFDLSARQVNKILHDKGVIFKQSGQWFLYATHHGKNLVDYETLPDFENGQYRTHRRMRWTEEGHRFVNEVVSDHLLQKALAMKPRYVELFIQF